MNRLPTLPLSTALLLIASAASSQAADAAATSSPAQVDSWQWAFFLLLAVVAFCGIVATISRAARGWLGRTLARRGVQLTLELLAIALAEWFILSNISARYLFTQTVTAGGDTASHYYTLDYLRHVLLPEWKISSWTPSNYAGFPILQFYFPLPFLMMCLLNLLIPLEVAFKLVTLAGTFLLPITAWAFLRLVRCPFPGPGLGAAFTLPFLFNTANSMWGGNILSTLAGEFSYSLGMSLSLLMLGVLYRGCTENKWLILSAAMVFLVGFSHGYALLFAEAMSAYLLLTSRGFVKRAAYLTKVYFLAFCLLGFWLLPLLAFGKWTTPYHAPWQIQTLAELAPNVLIPCLVFGGVGAIGLAALAFNWRAERATIARPLEFMLFGLFAAALLFAAAPRLGVVDIRYVPFAQLILCLLAAFTLGWLGRALERPALAAALLLIGATAATAWCSNKVDPVPAWTKWNYEGFQAKPAWPQFEHINRSLKGTFQDPRVVFEHSESHDAFGSTRAFESLPLFAGRATLEGLYMQASVSAPFVFYIQSQLSEQTSEPFPQYSYTTMSYPKARKRLEMFNVGELVLRSTAAKTAARAAEGYRLIQSFGEYETWRVTTNPGRYAVPLENEPILFRTDNWKFISYQWFMDDDLLDRHLVFLDKPASTPPRPFKVVADSLDKLPRVPIDTAGCKVDATIRNEEILIRTNWIGKPLLVKMSYHPNWKVEGADAIYLVSPSFMLIYPKQERVRLYYARGAADKAGMALTGLGILLVLINLPLLRNPLKKCGTGASPVRTTAGGSGGRVLPPRCATPASDTDIDLTEPQLGFLQRAIAGRRSVWSALAERVGMRSDLTPRVRWDPPERVRRRLVAALGGAVALVIALMAAHVYFHEPKRVFDDAVKLKDQKRYAQAREKFEEVLARARYADIGRQAAYYIAITYYLQKQDEAAIEAFKYLLRQHPHNPTSAEAQYHIGYCYLRMGQEAKGIEQMRLVRKEYPGSEWAGYAAERMKEHGADGVQ